LYLQAISVQGKCKYDTIELQVICYYWKAINIKRKVNVFLRTLIKVFIAIMLCGSLQINNHAIKAAPADILAESFNLVCDFYNFWLHEQS